MSQRIYKYFDPQVAGLVISASYATLKCSLPRDFNDPYELFLTVDYSSNPDALASYQELVGSMPQLPTTCFSTSPAVVPMWAHYGSNAEGFVLEFDKDKLMEAFPKSRANAVSYLDEADPGLTEMLHRAFVIGKPRYTYLLQSGVFNAAYFTKSTCWSYETEWRMVADESETRATNDLRLLDVPAQCITAVIAGAKASADLLEVLSKAAVYFGCALYRQRVGRTSITPYFLDEGGSSYVFDGAGVSLAAASCPSCREPLKKESEACSWCQITDDHRHEAAVRNPYRMLDRIGLLDSYIASMDGITDGIARRRE